MQFVAGAPSRAGGSVDLAGSKPVVLVWGATGRQGHSVARALLHDGGFRVRAATRKPDSDRAAALQGLGADVVRADQASEADVAHASKGAYAVFAVTNYWDHEVGQSYHREVEFGTRLAMCAKEAGAMHYVWSTLPDTVAVSGGKYDVPHMTSKVDAVVKAQGFTYHTFVEPANYYSNFQVYNFYRPLTAEDGAKVFQIGLRASDHFPSVDVDDDFGDVVMAALKEPKAHGQGEYLIVVRSSRAARSRLQCVIRDRVLTPSQVGEDLTMQRLVSTFTEVTGVPARLAEDPPDTLPRLPTEVALMINYIREFGIWPPGTDLSSGQRAAGRPLVSWAEWLRQTGWTGD